MPARARPSPGELPDNGLIQELKHLAASERCATAALAAHLPGLEERELRLAVGFSSLFSCCRAVLHLSEHEALNRIEAGRAARRSPVIVEWPSARSVSRR